MTTAPASNAAVPREPRAASYPGLALIDELYASFVRTLPEPLAGAAATLPVTLGLAPAGVPWSQVFSYEVTLAAPLLVAEAMPGLPEALVRDATLAHMLAVVEAFGTDRVEDGQVEVTSELVSLLAHVRRARDAVIGRVMASSEPAYAPAEQDTIEAIRTEQVLLRGGEGVALDHYLAVSSGKQRVGVPASIALARAGGWDARRVKVLASLLDDVWVALQVHDDVIDWEADLGRGGAWAVTLAAFVIPPTGPSSERETVPISMPSLVHRTGMLARMLRISARRFRAARRRAGALGIARLAAWAREREQEVGELALREAQTPGFANRAHALSGWARSVLSPPER